MTSALKAIIIFRLPFGFAVIQARPPKVTFASEFFVNAILPHIVAAKPADNPGRPLLLPMDKASPHGSGLTARNLGEHPITGSPHLAFLPDLAPSDFFLFDALKGQFSGRIFESPDELVEATLERVFLE
jgi:hypothetical protein